MQEFSFDLAQAVVGAQPDPSGFTVVVRGSKKYCCMQCHGDTWISPGGQQALKRRPDLKVFCLSCVQQGKVRDKDGNLPTPGRPSREVLAADLGEEMADKIISDDIDPTGLKSLNDSEQPSRGKEEAN